MWFYKQATGELLHDDQHITFGYSGYKEGKNNPLAQGIRGKGPLPCGVYRIGLPFDSPTHGPHVMHLTPVAGTDTLGRDSFLIHGDAIDHPGEASHGCIVASRPARDAVSAGVIVGDDLLKVTAS